MPENIILIVLCSLILVGLVVAIILLIKHKPAKEKDLSLDLKEIGALSNQIDNLSKEMKTNVELSVTQQVNKLLETNANNSKENNEKLLQFQTSISQSINTRFDALNKQIDTKLAEINKKVDEKLQEGFKGTGETLTQVRERLKAIDEAQKNIEELGKDVVSLKNVLEGNQTRGRYGEYQLSMVLQNIFGDVPNCYKEQYVIKKGKDEASDVKPDAVVFVPEPNKMICIDSKFPFQDYSRMFEATTDEEKENLKKNFALAVKKHITTVKDKYIIPGKTAGYAMIFIPNDGVFAFIHHELEDVVDYAREKNVVLTSPSTLPPMLVTINMVRIEAERAKNAQEISKQLQILGKQFELFGSEWSKFSNQLKTISNTRDDLDKRVVRINDKFVTISNSSSAMIEEKPEEIETK